MATLRLGLAVRAYSSAQMPPSSGKKQQPSWGMASISSYLVCLMRSSVLKVSKCWGPTEVSTPGFFPAMARIMWDMTPCGAINSAKSPALMWG